MIRQLVIVSVLTVVMVIFGIIFNLTVFHEEEKKTIHIYSYTPKVTDVLKEEETDT